jgi:hypothetical protein
VLHELDELYATITGKIRRTLHTERMNASRCSATPKAGWMNERLKKRDKKTGKKVVGWGNS